jgi:hypothetical protein
MYMRVVSRLSMEKRLDIQMEGSQETGVQEGAGVWLCGRTGDESQAPLPAPSLSREEHVSADCLFLAMMYRRVGYGEEI